ncbi:hypothetical protein B0H17DRAFT_1214685 [Mycena rosella]|uniref:Uncharacterized protein n=1 Tax=Mycena rosella TaxID=1033263 RepID=A0AAD7CMF9_MYCRO|nr:hypothetical protein B0H17DRAFT_1214685 [Mycena rosella]
MCFAPDTQLALNKPAGPLHPAFAFEAFDIIIKTRSPLTDAVAMEGRQWCCKAALISYRIPRFGCMLATGLFSLLPTLYGSGRAYHHRGGDCALAGDFGALDNITFEEQFNALFVAQDAHGDSTRRRLLENAVVVYWPHQSEDVSFTPLLGAVQACKRATVTRMSPAVLRAKPRWTEFAELVEHFTQMRVVPELGAMHSTNTSTLEPWRNVVGVRLELPCRGRHWYRAVDTEWKKSIDGAILHGAWPAALTVLSTLLDSLPEDVRKPLISVVLPTLADRLVSQLYLPLFYKSCAASNKDFTVMNHLCAITAISRFLPDFWTRDAEMMSVALLNSSKTNAPANGEPVWGAARLGQSVLLGEIIGRIQAVLRTKDMSSAPDNVYVDILKFVIILEMRLGLLLDVKERTSLVPLSQRMLFMMLFRKIRL